MRRSKSLSAFAVLFAAANLCFAEEWPKWRGPEGTGISTERGLAEKWPADGPKRVWSQQVGLGFSSPIALDGKIYQFSQDGNQDGNKDVLACFDAESGKVLWNQSSDGGYPNGDYEGSRATPTIDSEKIYTYGGGGDLICRELADGSLVWHLNVLKETNSQLLQWGQASSPLVTAELVYVQSGQGGAIAVAVDKSTGKICWQSAARGKAGYAAPIIVEVSKHRQLIVFAGEAVFGMDPETGKTIWQQPWRTQYGVNAATPIFDHQQLLVTSDYGAGCMMLTLSASGAKKDFQSNTVDSKIQTPILEGQYLYCNSKGTIECVTWPDCKLVWEAKEHDLRLGAGGSLVRVGDNLIAMSERGKLSLVQATPQEHKLISQVSLFDFDRVWSTPLIYHGNLYAKGRDELVCLDISGAGHASRSTEQGMASR